MKIAKISDKDLKSVQDPKDCAKDHIQCAITELGKIAKDDTIAKDSIANLAVVLLDLQ